ncbi:hypothetical protein [Polaribacter gangjinensis]|uniref:Lipoprotein n=1 Tax=Polaribacter gangjinensis TaxID=574710 RepID=A0A2S7WAA4_9FLAO|nr:hypothetical protein [Polaribacter gangjinensis]PQJ74560.1 hypothetical protein BTO13_04475 [Polaribacter gangjinensis]
MKKIKTLFFVAITAIAFSFTGCEVFEEETTDAVCNIDSEYNSYLNAVTAFSNNPTRTNCNNMKTRANAFISAASRCSGGVDVSSARDMINSIDCSDF